MLYLFDISVSCLSLHGCRCRELAQEEPASAQPAQPSAEPFDPQRFYGAAHHSRQAVDQYLALAREGLN
ncbi:hypothetical protein CKO42_22250 [Lamprobacter modestohalophilus]|uniref:Uncharacterized protein n=1 Tax=Lamprobacter modestohalophilus TaxID=1064514 RepID=A0A9X1B6P9_9GAMM|nr:hypothetical protein [Lamprobacter modestohalophilus]